MTMRTARFVRSCWRSPQSMPQSSAAGVRRRRPSRSPSTSTSRRCCIRIVRNVIVQAGPDPSACSRSAETAKRAAQLAAVTGSGFMPPWKADGHPDEFVAQPRLTRDEVQLFARWAKAPVEGPGPATRAAQVVRRLVPGPAGPHRHPAGRLHAARRTLGRLPHLCRAAQGERDEVRARHRVPSGERARRPPRQHPHRSHRRLTPPRRRRSRCPATTV